MGRVLGIDYGNSRVGLALSDELKIIASPYKTIKNEGVEAVIGQIRKEIEENKVEAIVVGVPRSLKGGVTEQTEKVLSFVGKLRETIEIPIVEVDERLSSVEATRAIHLKGKKAGHNKAEIDKIAASIILQTYLDSASFKG